MNKMQKGNRSSRREYEVISPETNVITLPEISSFVIHTEK